MINPENLNFLCKYKSGSYLYGTNTETSDIDWCGVYTDPIYNIQNYNVLINVENKTESIDNKFCEFRTHAEDVINGDFFKLEPLLINANKLNFNSEEWKMIRSHSYYFINSEAIFKWVINYCHKELFWANSPINLRKEIRHPKIIDRFNKFGFDNAAFGHCILTATRASWFFEDDIFYTNVSNKNIRFCNLILQIKENPANFTALDLNHIGEQSIKNLRDSFKNRKNNYKPNLKVLNDLIELIYH